MRAMKRFTAPPDPILAARKRINSCPKRSLEMFKLLKEQQASFGFLPTTMEVANALLYCSLRGWTVQQYATTM